MEAAAQMERIERVSIRAFGPGDREVVIAGRDAEIMRWLGPGSAQPAPSAMIVAGPDLVGWVDADSGASWLARGEVNLGYAVFARYRGRGYAAGAVRLLLADLAARRFDRALLVVDRENTASLAVARAIGATPGEHAASSLFPTSVMHVVELKGRVG